MYNTEQVYQCLKNVLGWKDHYDLTDIPALPADLTASESGQYFQSINSTLMDLAVIASGLPANLPLETFLESIRKDSILELLNDVSALKKINRTGSELRGNDVIYNSQGWRNDTIWSDSKFVGVLFRLDKKQGIRAIINKIALQLTDAQTDLTIYVYHSHQVDPIAEISFTSTKGGQFNWIDANQELYGDNGSLAGGTYYFGYYQDDLIGSAIEYKNLNWRTGYCNTCSSSSAGMQVKYNKISKDVYMSAFYVESDNIEGDRTMFDPQYAYECDSTNWGLNFNISTGCDLTHFWCINKLILVYPIQLKTQQKVYQMLLDSTQTNSITEDIKRSIFLQLNGDEELRQKSIPDKYQESLKALQIDMSGISKRCLNCFPNSGVKYNPI